MNRPNCARVSAVAVALAVICAVAPRSALHAQEPAPRPEALQRASFGLALLGFAPQGEFADNVDFAGGFGGSLQYELDPQGLVTVRLDLNYLIYGRETYRTRLGSGPLGLIDLDVTTTNNIFAGGIGLQLGAPGRTVRPYGNASAGFSYFFTSSSVEGSDNSDAFASSTNYDDGGFAWTAGGGLYVPLSTGRTPVNLDLGVRWVDNGERAYLRDDGITFSNGDVQLNPVRTKAEGMLFTLGVTIGMR